MYRCHNPKNKQYKNYGARGIFMCEDWKDFNKFCADIYPCPVEGYHLDREDNDKGYSKENCRWVSAKTNYRNKRNNHYYETHLGKMCQSEIIEKIKYTRKQFQRCIEKYGEKGFLELFKQNKLPKKREIVDLMDIIGTKINNFTILQLDPDKSTGARYLCVCDCGYTQRRSRYKLKNESSKYCISCSKKGMLNPKNK